MIYDHDHYEDRKRAGLCVHCNTDAEPGKVLCARHLEISRTKAKTRRQKFCDLEEENKKLRAKIKKLRAETKRLRGEL